MEPSEEEAGYSGVICCLRRAGSRSVGQIGDMKGNMDIDGAVGEEQKGLRANR